MRDWSHLAGARVIRLNASLHANDYEFSLYEQYGLKPVFCEPYTPDEIIPYVEDCDALFAVSVNLPTRVIESLKRCKVISRLGTGTDKIDVTLATQMGIVVTNVPYFCVEEQADHTMMLMLALERQLPLIMNAVRDGNWNQVKHAAGSTGRTRRMSSLTLGLVGFGNSARETAMRAKGFGMRVLATRRNKNASTAIADAIGVEMVDMDTLLRESDYVSLHLPLGKETYHLIDEAAIRKMKPSARLINTSRGAIVDEMALARLLQERVIAGAGIDTFEHIDIFGEEKVPDHPFVTLDNVILTPHIAAMSVQAKQDVGRGGIENVVSILSGHWCHPDNIVNRGVVPRSPLAEYDPSLFTNPEYAEHGVA
jgi:D-3-phosphoglycerate dehydrogenase / 2-oxoglutarate reductase